MEVKELRLGNYVEWLKDSPFVVKKICDDGNITIGVIGDDNSSVKLNQSVKPIPLTEEWLLRAGFVKTEYEPTFQIDEDEKVPCVEYSKQHGLMNIMDWGNGFILSNSFSFKLRVTIVYVHQLQNLYFALTGEELQFKDI